MGADSSADKQGLQSSGRKQQTTRHGTEPTPAMRPVPGAFGKDRKPVRTEEREESTAGEPASAEGANPGQPEATADEDAC
jgi:hypothetical protein